MTISWPDILVARATKEKIFTHSKIIIKARLMKLTLLIKGNTEIQSNFNGSKTFGP